MLCCVDFVENTNSGDICQYLCLTMCYYCLTLAHVLMVKKIHTLYALLVHDLHDLAYK